MNPAEQQEFELEERIKKLELENRQLRQLIGANVRVLKKEIQKELEEEASKNKE